MADFSDQHAILLEEAVKSNREVILENQKLREELKARDEGHNRVMRSVLDELEKLKERNDREQVQRSQARRLRANKKKSKVQVSPACRVSICFFLC